MNPNQQKPQQPNLPEQTWAVSKEDKEIIQDLGKKLTVFLFDYAKEKAHNGRFHIKNIAGAFQYFMEIHNQKGKIISDDMLIAQHNVEQYNLGSQIDEPFAIQEEIPQTKAQRIETLEKELAELKKEETPTEVEAPTPAPEAENVAEAPAEEIKADEDVEDASVAPSTGPATQG